MIQLTDIFNQQLPKILIRKRIAQTVRMGFDNPDHRFIISSIVFKGFLVDLRIQNGIFSAFLINGNHMFTLFEKETSYSLVNYITCVREWLEEVLLKEDSIANPVKRAKRLKVKPFENFYDQRHGLRLQQFNVIKNYRFGVSYL